MPPSPGTTGMIGAAVMHFGSQELKDEVLKKFAQGEATADLVPDGNSTAVVPNEPFETAVSARTTQQNVGFYLTDTFDITSWLSLTAGFRFA